MDPGARDLFATPADRRVAHVRKVLEPGVVQARFAPLVRLSDGAVIGYEARPVFPPVPGLGPLPARATHAAARAAGLRPELDAACWRAVAAAGPPPAGRLLVLAVGAETLARCGPDDLAGVLHSRLVLAVADAEDADRDLLRRRLSPWVERGAMVAVADSGTGAASLELVAALRPDFVTLPPMVVSGATRESGRTFLRAIAAFAHDVGARVIAGGVERRQEWHELVEAEVDHGAGPLFGVPGPAWPALNGGGPAAAPRRSPAESGTRRVDVLDRELAAASTVRESATAVVGHLARLGRLPSVYLVQDGRLRCQAQRGYWQILEGIPLTQGLMGRVARTGERSLVQDVGECPDYLPAVESVRAELCVPLRVGARVVGVLNLESSERLDAATIDEVERCAGLLAARLADVHELDDASPAQRLARAAARLSGLAEPDAIVREAITAALAVSGMESAMVAGEDAGGDFAVLGASGPFAGRFTASGPAVLAGMAAWVAHGSSSYTMGDVGGKGSVGDGALREAGAGALVVLPLPVHGRAGLLVLGDRATRVLPTEQVELLELLAAHVAAGLAMAEAVAELRVRAEIDPLTGVGHHGAFHGALPERRAALPDGRRLAVLVCDVDRFKTLNDRLGHPAGDDLLRTLATLLGAVAGEHGAAYRLGGDEFGVLVEVDGEAQARALAGALCRAAADRLGTTLSVGVALAEPGEEDAALVARADAAAYAVKREGRDGVALAPPARRLAARA